LNLDFKIFDKALAGVQAEEYMNSAIPNGKSLYFADIHLIYTWVRHEVA
jgi:hypothetical protein